MIVYGSAFINVATPTLMYIVISDKALFDAINLPAKSYEKVITKTEQMAEITVIFQYWLPELGPVAKSGTGVAPEAAQ